MQDFMFRSDVSSSSGTVELMEQVCSQCAKGFGLTNDRKNCLPCPNDCLLCLYASTCIAVTNDQVLALIGVAGGC